MNSNVYERNICTPFDALNSFESHLIVVIDGYLSIDKRLERTHHHYYFAHGLSSDVHRALLSAARCNDIETVRFLSTNMMDNEKSFSRYCGEVICIARMYNYLELMKFCLTICPDYNIHEHEDAMFRLSAECGYLEMVQYLVCLGADLKAKDGEYILRAARNGHVEVVQYLISLGANKYARLTDFDLLCCSVDTNNIEFIDYVLCDLGITDTIGNALICASNRGYVDVVKHFISFDRSLFTKSHFDGAAVEASRCGHIEVLNYILSIESDINLDRVMDQACFNGHLEVVKLVSKLKVLTNIEKYMHTATFRRHLELIDFLFPLWIVSQA